MIAIEGLQIFICYPWEEKEHTRINYASVQFKKMPHRNPMVMLTFYTIKIDLVRM